MNNLAKSRQIPSKKNSKVLCFFGIATIIALIAGDKIRVSLPGQPIYISLTPLLFTLIGVFFVHISGTLRNMPKPLKSAVFWMVILCCYGTLVGLANDLLYKQIIAGWISYAGPIPGLLLGYAIGKTDFASTRFTRWNYYSLLIVLMIAVMQQFGLFGVKQIVLEGTPLIRGVQGVGNFKYTSGPFRNASVFSIFLACSTAIWLFSYVVDTKSTKKNHIIIVSIVVLLVSLLAARRSGLLMLLGVLLPFFFLGFTRISIRVAILIIPFIVIGGPLLNEDSFSVQKELELKFAHSVTNTGVIDRVTQVFDVRDSDWNLLSISGDGLGSYGSAVRAGGSAAAAKADIRLNMHPIIHYGWFKDLATLGPIGLIIHILFFYWIAVMANPFMVVKRKINNPVRWSGFGLCVATAIVYFFIATSWLQGITGGVIFGITMGFVSGRLSFLSLSPTRSSTRSLNKAWYNK